MKKVLLGYCAVDSGQLMIIDPCYLGKWKDGDFESKEPNHYNTACKLTLKGHGGQMTVSGVAGDGVVFPSGYGDGNYPVTASINKDGRVVKIEIDME